ncbi:MAG: hypothetical protein M9894_09275 [Planctomycetes bacterium]|nr:hypothetical protein [Planctomycetota bacterium]
MRAATSPVRCPFCHDQVAVDAPGWVACVACLARHHAACWREAGCCGACGRAEVMSPPGRRAAARRRLAGVTAATSLGLLATWWTGDQRRERPREDGVVAAPAPAARPGEPDPLTSVRALLKEGQWTAARARLAEVAPLADADAVTALEEECAREEEAERLYNSVIDRTGGRGDPNPDQIEATLRRIDRRSRRWPEAQAYLAWNDADRQVRAAQRAYEEGDRRAFDLLDEAERLGDHVLGPEARASIDARRRAWRRSFDLDAAARERLVRGDLAGARESLQALLAEYHARPLQARAQALLAVLDDVATTEAPTDRLQAGLTALAALDDGAALAWFGAALAADPRLEPHVRAALEQALPGARARAWRSPPVFVSRSHVVKPVDVSAWRAMRAAWLPPPAPDPVWGPSWDDLPP